MECSDPLKGKKEAEAGVVPASGMLMTVDIGNTQIKLGAFDGDELKFVSRLQTVRERTADEYAVLIREILSLYGVTERSFSGAIISCVVPPLSATFRRALQKALGCERILTVSPGIKTGLNIRIENPASTGADLVCLAVQALEKYPTPCCVFSMGTVTAVIALDRSGAFLGGSIMPGVNISMEALSNHTAQLPAISLDDVPDVIGTNTVDCMRSGVLFGTAGMIDGMCRRLRERLGEDTTFVATGGMASTITPHCRETIQLDEYIVLEGLRTIYYKNTKEKN